MGSFAAASGRRSVTISLSLHLGRSLLEQGDGQRQTLSRSYGRCLAEFLNEGSLERLGLLDLSTCVGLRYGRLSLLIVKLFWSAWVTQIGRQRQPFIRVSTEAYALRQI